MCGFDQLHFSAISELICHSRLTSGSRDLLPVLKTFRQGQYALYFFKGAFSSCCGSLPVAKASRATAERDLRYLNSLTTTIRVVQILCHNQANLTYRRQPLYFSAVGYCL